MSIVVGVRVRPFNTREKDKESVCCIEMPGNNQTIIINRGHPRMPSISLCTIGFFALISEERIILHFLVYTGTDTADYLLILRII